MSISNWNYYPVTQKQVNKHIKFGLIYRLRAFLDRRGVMMRFMRDNNIKSKKQLMDLDKSITESLYVVNVGYLKKISKKRDYLIYNEIVRFDNIQNENQEELNFKLEPELMKLKKELEDISKRLDLAKKNVRKDNLNLIHEAGRLKSSYVNQKSLIKYAKNNISSCRSRMSNNKDNLKLSINNINEAYNNFAMSYTRTASRKIQKAGCINYMPIDIDYSKDVKDLLDEKGLAIDD